VPGDQVVLLSGPFKGFDATISHSDGTNVYVCVNATILGQREIQLPVKEEEVERKTELQNAEVQNLRE
jgi:transcription antitermination factor NusG